MSRLDPEVLTAKLLAAGRDIDDVGPDHPHLLFAIHGPRRRPRLQYALQLPGRAGGLLQDFFGLGLRTQGGIIGLVLITGILARADFDGLLALSAVAPGPTGDQVDLLDRLSIACGLLHRAPMEAFGRGRAVIGVFRDGYTAVLVHQEGQRLQTVEHRAHAAGDHEAIAALLAHLLVGDQVFYTRVVAVS